MRLEKGHFIVGQDTDGLTQAFAVGLGSLIKLDKPDFAGRPELVWQHERDDYHGSSACSPSTRRASRRRRARSSSAGRRADARSSAGSRRAGCRRRLNRSICLGFVAPHLCQPGSLVTVRLPDGSDVPARVMEHHAHVDPEGVRLRG